MGSLDQLLGRLWQDYVAINSQARRVHELLASRGEQIVNDHIAFRTFDHPRVGIPVLAATFLRFGYREADQYRFEEKKLLARHYEHSDPAKPKVFISELRTGEFSPDVQRIVRGLVDQVPADLPGRWDFCASGRPWRVSFADYERLGAESEYAAWLSAFGFRANHFTVSVNALKGFQSLQDLNAFLKENGFSLLTSGGEIKGSPADLLEQSSTVASKVEVEFADGEHEVPGCYYEFARRYPKRDGTLFQGFVAKSADKIFESTDRR